MQCFVANVQVFTMSFNMKDVKVTAKVGLDFSEKVAVITGASSGIGAATAKELAQRGAKLTLIGRDEKRLVEVSDICEHARGNKPLCLLLDLTIDRNCEEIARKTIETFHKIDILINCAGKGAVTSLFDNNMEVFDDLMRLNLRMPYKMTQVCVPHLKKTKGSVVNVFGAPMRTRPGFLPFSMFRDAMDRFTKVGAVELASEGIRMNAVRPGLARTNFLLNLNVDEDDLAMAYEAVSNIMPNNKLLEADEIAKMVVFAASENCPNLVGSSIVLDAGLSV